MPKLSLPAFTAPAMRWLVLRAAILRHPLLLGVRVLLVDPQGRILLVRHSYTPGWHMPGGGVEIGETAREAALREVREEAGLRIEGAMPLLGLYLNRAMGNRDHVAVYVARAFSALPDAKADWEIVERGFFDPESLPEATTPGTRARIAEALGGAPVSETW